MSADSTELPLGDLLQKAAILADTRLTYGKPAEDSFKLEYAVRELWNEYQRLIQQSCGSRSTASDYSIMGLNADYPEEARKMHDFLNDTLEKHPEAHIKNGTLRRVIFLLGRFMETRTQQSEDDATIERVANALGNIIGDVWGGQYGSEHYVIMARHALRAANSPGLTATEAAQTLQAQDDTPASGAEG